MVTLLTRLDARDEAAAKTLAASLAELKAAVASEPGHVAYDVFRTQEDAATFYVQERWATGEDAERHARLVETQGYIGRSAALLARPLETATLLAL